MKKEDYMKLSKERLAELLEERDNEQRYAPPYPPITIQSPLVPCYAPDGICTNPLHDCVNCPKLQGGGCAWSTSGSTGIQKEGL